MFRCVRNFTNMARLTEDGPTWALLRSHLVASSPPALRGFATKKIEDDDVRQLNRSEDEEDKAKRRPRAKTLDFKQKIYLEDLDGKVLGLKTRQEAEVIAKKNHWVLVPDDTIKKVPTFRLADPRKMITDSMESSEEPGASSDLERSKSRSKSGKTLMFNSKVSEHDLATRVNQVKKWLVKNQETRIRVTAMPANLKHLEKIGREFEKVFTEQCGCKINQRRLSDVELRFHVVPVNLELIHANFKSETNTSDTSEEAIADTLANMDKMDPHQLLNDDFLDKLKKSK